MTFETSAEVMAVFIYAVMEPFIVATIALFVAAILITLLVTAFYELV